jgi:hypothetical protein
MTFMVSPDGQPLIGWADEDLDIYREELSRRAQTRSSSSDRLRR